VKRTTFFIFLLTTTPSLLFASQELLQDRSLESNTTSYWTEVNLSSFAIVNQAAGKVHSGLYSAKITDTKSSGYIYQQINVTPGYWYCASGWFYDNDPNGYGAVKIDWLDESGSSVGSDTSEYSTDYSTWQYLTTHIVQAPADAEACKVKAYVKVTASTTTLYVDDFSFTISEGKGEIVEEVKVIKIKDSPFYPYEDLKPHNCLIIYNVPDSTIKTLKVFDINGREVRTLLNRDTSVNGKGSFYWNGRDDDGNVLPVGVYIVYIEAEEANGRRVAHGSASVIIGRRLKR